MEELVNRIIKYRAKHNLSQASFAQLVGCTLQTINNIENGYQNPSRLTVAKIENVLENDEK